MKDYFRRISLRVWKRDKDWERERGREQPLDLSSTICHTLTMGPKSSNIMYISVLIHDLYGVKTLIIRLKMKLNVNFVLVVLFELKQHTYSMKHDWIGDTSPRHHSITSSYCKCIAVSLLVTAEWSRSAQQANWTWQPIKLVTIW